MTDYDYPALREAMIDSQLRTSGINDPKLLAAFRAVPREDHVPAALQPLAYIDRPLDLGDGRSLNPPETQGRLVQEAQLSATDHVLLIGTATDYIRAVLWHLVAKVDACAPDAVRPGKPIYDAIIIDGALSAMPDAIIARLKIGGRLTMGLNEAGVTRVMRGRKSAGGFGMVPVADMECMSLLAPAVKTKFVFA